MRRRATVAVALLAAVAAVVAIGTALDTGPGDRGGARAGAGAARSIVTPPRVYPYPAGAVRDFVAGCVRAAPAEERTCRCVADDLQTRLPYAEYAAADDAIRRGRPVPPRARRAIDAATRYCRGIA